MLTYFWPMNLVGVVLCGGRSQRMGQDKGLLSLDGVPWFQCQAGKLQLLGLPTIVSLRATQAKQYRPFTAETTVVEDQFSFEGPLNGILSTAANYPGKSLLVLATDYPNVSTEVLAKLLGEFELNNVPIMVESGGRSHPLIAIYDAQMLSELVNRFQGYSGKLPGLIQLFDQYNGRRLTLTKELSDTVLNLNAPQDLKKG